MFEGIGGYFLLVAVFFFAVLASYGLNRLMIYYQKKRQLSQPIHALGVKKHFLKNGTPSLGGLAIFATTMGLYLCFGFSFLDQKAVLGLIFITSAFFLIGLFDDLKKIFHHDERGLSPSIRIGLEVMVSLLFLLLINYDQKFKWEIALFPFSYRLSLGALVIVILLFALVGTANAGNLMDGLDGLEAGVNLIALAPLLLLSISAGKFEISLFLIILLGASIGFLMLNMHPAKIFMGDCGSLFLGVTLAASIIVLNKLILLPFLGLLYVIEALSVILQVGYFKATRRRIFLMAPLHHHFELKKVPEYRVVMSYYLVQIAISISIVLLEVLM